MKFSNFIGNKNRLPALLQMEAGECGVVSVAMIASYYGHHVSMSYLRQNMSVSIKGSNLRGLVNVAKSLGLESRAIKVPIDQVRKLLLPCVLHWDMNHFVVLKKVCRNTVVVHDPAFGVREIAHAAFAKHFTGAALELKPSQSFLTSRKRPPVDLMSLTGPVFGLRRGLAEIFLLALALEILAVAMPFQLQWVVDNALQSADRSLIGVIGVGFMFLILMQSGISLLRNWVVVRLSANMTFQLRGKVFRHLMRLPVSYFEKRHLGATMTNVNSIKEIQHIVTTKYTQAVVDGIMAVGTVLVMFIYDSLLTSVVLLTVVIYLSVRLVLFHSLREAKTKEIISGSKEQTHFVESVRGVQTLRLFDRVDERAMTWSNICADEVNANLIGQKIYIAQQSSSLAIFGLKRVLIVWLAAFAVIENRFSVGMLFAFLAYEDQFSNRITALIDNLFEWKMLSVHMERVADIVHVSPEQEGHKHETDTTMLKPTVELRGVTFRYAHNEDDVLTNINIVVGANECVALSGPSGGGKTTLVKIILGLLEPTSGEVYIGGHSIRQLGLANYRSIVGTVMQSDILFTGSIEENISFFDPAPDSEWILTCAKSAAIHEEIVRMPMGYHSLIGDTGNGLSGGQVQRLLLARALYRRPKILVLDEATSHLDLWNERAVNEAIGALNLTRIIVAHRSETVSMAQRVIYIENGRVVSFLRS